MKVISAIFVVLLFIIGAHAVPKLFRDGQDDPTMCCLGSYCACGLEIYKDRCYPICKAGYFGVADLCKKGTSLSYSRGNGYAHCTHYPPSSDAPQQIHTSFGADPSTMLTVMWSTRVAGTPILHMGTSPSLSDAPLYKGTTFHFNSSQNTQGLQYIHTVEVIGLQPDIRYYYTVETNGLVSEVYNVSTVKGTNDWSPQILVIGDMGRDGGAPTLASLVQEAVNGWPDALIHAGDFAYDLNDHNGTRGDEFMNRIQSIATHIPYLTCVGNHEIEGMGNFSHYVNRFHMPNKEKSANMYWSIDVGPAHIIFFSTEMWFANVYPVPGGGIDAQMAWLKADLDLANANRAERPWIITVSHRPLYCSNTDLDCIPKEVPFIRPLEDLFHYSGVDLMLEAHEHSYERLYPVFNNQTVGKSYTNPSAMVHLVSGQAGCNEDNGTCLNAIRPDHLGPWSAKQYSSDDYYSYGKMTVHNATHLTFQLISDWYGTVLDEMVLVQEHHGPRPQQ